MMVRIGVFIVVSSSKQKAPLSVEPEIEDSVHGSGAWQSLRGSSTRGNQSLENEFDLVLGMPGAAVFGLFGGLASTSRLAPTPQEHFMKACDSQGVCPLF
jgi:hypothetical protein